MEKAKRKNKVIFNPIYLLTLAFFLSLNRYA